MKTGRFLKKVYKKLKDPWFKARSKYIKYYETLPIAEKTILLESQHGTEISGNIFYILQYLCSNDEFKDWTIYISSWIRHLKKINSILQENQIEGVQVLVYGSDEYFRTLASAKYLINDNTFHLIFIKKQGQIYLNTWHGTPLKTLGKRMESGKSEIGNAQKNFVASDYLLFPNQQTRNAIMEDYMVEGLSDAVGVYCGYPRNTVFFDAEKREMMREKYELEDKKIYAYMPTFRSSASAGGTEKNDIYLKYFLYEIDKQLDDDEILYVNLHPVAKKNVNFKRFSHIRPFPFKEETYDFLNIADCLVTDYSSVFFDFANTGRKIVLFPYDQDEYLQNRGTYIPFEELPFPKVYDVPSLLSELRTEKVYDDKEFLSTYCAYDGRNATKELVDFVFWGRNGTLKVEQETREAKENVLIYVGNLALNGITTSIKNLLSQVDLAKRNYYLSFRGEITQRNEKTLDEFSDQVKYFAISGDMDVTIRDRVIRKFFKWNFIKTPLYMKLMGKRIKEEMLRCFSAARFDTLIQFNGYESEIILLWSQFDGNSAIYVHNDMLQEAKTRKNQRLDVLKYAYNAFDKVAVVTDDILEPTREIAKSDKNLVVVRNVIDAVGVREKSEMPFELGEKTTVYPDEEMLEKILGREGKIFVSNGRFSPEKGHLRLLKAFRRVVDERPDVSLIIMGGNVTGDYFQRTQDCIVELGLENHVVLLCKLSNPFPLLRQCDYFVLSSFYEGFGLVLAEADILGKPVISTDIPGPRGFMQKYGGHLVESSEDGLYQGMMDLLAGKIQPMNVDYEAYNREAVAQFEAIFQ